MFSKIIVFMNNMKLISRDSILAVKEYISIILVL